jgi:hypothetical protein
MAAATEPVRLLAIRSEVGYTDRMDRALKDEPEAVTAEEQHWLTRQARVEATERARSDWHRRRAQLRAEIDELAHQPYTRGMGSELRLMERHIARIDRMIGTQLLAS